MILILVYFTIMRFIKNSWFFHNFPSGFFIFLTFLVKCVVLHLWEHCFFMSRIRLGGSFSLPSWSCAYFLYSSSELPICTQMCCGCTNICWSLTFPSHSGSLDVFVKLLVFDIFLLKGSFQNSPADKVSVALMTGEIFTAVFLDQFIFIIFCKSIEIDKEKHNTFNWLEHNYSSNSCSLLRVSG